MFVPSSQEIYPKTPHFSDCYTPAFDNPVIAPISNWIPECIQLIFSSGYALVNSSLQTTYNFFCDGNHPWKLTKYRTILEQTLLALKSCEGIAKKIYPHINCSEIDKIIEQLNQAHDPNRPLNKFVAELLQLLCTSTEDQRQKYLSFMWHVRAALDSTHYAEELSLIHAWKGGNDKKPCLGLCLLLDLCYERLNNVHIYPFCDYVVHKLIHVGCQRLREISSGDPLVLSSDFENSDLEVAEFKAIANIGWEYGAPGIAVNWGKLRGTVNKNFDPNTQSNTAFTLGSIELFDKEGNLKTLTLQRIGCPTRDGLGLTSFAQITLEFRAYMESCRLRGERHLYISLQNEESKWVGYEAHRNDALKVLQQEYPNTFYFVVLDQDSAFYHQIGEFDMFSLKTSIFLEQLEARMFKTDGNFYFSSAWLQDPAFNRLCKRTMQTTLAILFGTTPDTMDLQQRKDFIEIFYAIFVLQLARYANAQKMNISCKDAIDRAGKTLSLLIKILQIAQKHAHSPEHKRIHRTYTHAPALFVKKQAIVSVRRERLNHAIQWLYHSEVQQRLMDPTISLLPINYTGDFLIKRPMGQRPNENVFLACLNVIKELMTDQVRSNLLDQIRFENLITAHINQDLFIKEATVQTLRETFREYGLSSALNALLSQLATEELSAEELSRLKTIVTDLLFVTLIHSGILAPTQIELLSPSKLKQLLKNPKELLNMNADRAFLNPD